jgi:hypothetical protein
MRKEIEHKETMDKHNEEKKIAYLEEFKLK